MRYTRPCGEGYTKETYSVATAEGLNIEEGKDLVTLEELEGRDITWTVVSAIFSATESVGRRG